MNLHDALKWLDEETNTNNVEDTCFITKQPIQHKITLPCSHSFEYDALYQNLIHTQKRYHYHKCPYCRTKFDGFIPYYETNQVRKFVPSMFKHNYMKCSYIFKSGKNKNCQCTKEGHLFKNGTYCLRHKRQKDMELVVSIHVCKATLKNGKTCTCNVFDKETHLCKRHFNLKNKELKK
jgi:hypothetical protein